MASFFSQASSFFGRSQIASNYTITDGSAAGPSTTTNAGLWKIQRAVRGGSSAAGALAAAVGAGRPSTPGMGASAAGTSSAAAHGSPSAAGTNGSATSSTAASNGTEREATSGTATPSNDRAVVSIWSHTAYMKSSGKERELVIEQLKKEASTLTRLRHPCILEVAEPLEELRSELIFATEPVMATLSLALQASESSGRASDNMQLDEIEIQKGLLQVARGLEFLHGAGLVHGNLTTEAILVNTKGDWKLSGFAFLTPLKRPDGAPTSYQYPDYDPSLPPAMSRNFDYLAPEYALDEKLEPANDMYALGCVMFAAHNKGQAPFRNRNNLQNVRQNADALGTIASSPSWQRMNRDLVSVLSTLLTRYPGSRPTAAAFQRSEYFNNLLTQTLKFMERDTFAGKNKDERVSFLKGLYKILDQFSDRLLRRKVLPALLELMSDRTLLPFILPNVFYISKNLSSIEFTSNVLPRLKPLFNIQDPPQNQLMLLEQVELFVTKTSPAVFREGVTPLLYSSLEAENVTVQEKALQTVPRLCEVLEYSHVKEVLFPKIATLFTKTRVLSVKCSTLICFHSMISVLDKHTLTEKLVPILARIKTREPSVMIATLAVHEAMSKKVDRDTLAMSIIPQLWTMSIGPQLNAEQFERFMKAIDEMSLRVRKEQLAHLQEMKRMQEASTTFEKEEANGRANNSGLTASGEVDFATLVGSSQGGKVARDLPMGGDALDVMGWDDLEPATPSKDNMTPAITPTATGTSRANAFSGGATLGSTPMAPSRSFNAANSAPANATLAPPPPRPTTTLSSSSSAMSLSNSSLSAKPAPLPPPGWVSGSTLTPSSSMSSSPLARAGASMSTQSSSSGGPNYNISLSPASQPEAVSNPLALTSNSFSGLPPLVPQTSSLGSVYPSQTSAASSIQARPSALSPGSAGPATPSWGGNVLQPTQRSSAAKQGAGSRVTSNAWSDFDPLK